MASLTAFHLDGLREEGLPIPEPTTLSEYVKLAKAAIILRAHLAIAFDTRLAFVKHGAKQRSEVLA